MSKEICSVCKQFDVNTEDPLYDNIKERHEMRHTRHDRYSERDGHKISMNLIYGKVRWLPVCKHNVPHEDECTQCLIRDDLLLD